MATCIVVPIVANGIRAWGTIGIAEWRGIEFASGFDHVLYGWFFFAFVIALVMGLAWRYFDRAPTGHTIDAERIMSSRPLSRLAEATIGAGAAIGLIMLIATAAFGWSTAAGRLAAKLPAQVDLPQVSGWHRVTYSPAYPWEPLHGGADHRLLGSYADTEGRRVEVSYALYASQGEGREAGGFGQGAMPPDSGWAWRSPGPAIAGSIVQRLSAPGPVEREAATFYRSGSVLTGSNIRLKLANIADRLFLRAHPTAVLIVSAEEREGAPADEAIRRFLRAGGPTGPWMDRIGGTR
jgi:EpsI family protein